MIVRLAKTWISPGVLELAPFEVDFVGIVTPAASSVALGFGFESRVLHEPFELADRHLMRAHEKRASDSHTVNWLLIDQLIDPPPLDFRNALASFSGES